MQLRTLAFVLAGGKGTRLYPLTKERAKPAVPFGGRYRIVDFVLSNLINSGVYSIYVLIQFKSQSLLQHLREGWEIGGLLRNHFIIPVPAQMRSAGEDWYRGTADAIYQNVNLIEQADPHIVVIFGADHIYRMNIREMIEFHAEKRARVTIAAIPVPKEFAREFGVIEVDENYRVVAFHEKNPNAPTMPGGMSIAKMLKDTTAATRHIRSIFALDTFIKTNKQNSLQFAGKYYADDDHGSVPLITEYDALRFIFSYYKYKFTEQDFTDSSTAFVTRYKAHYQTVSKELGYSVSPPEVLTNGLAYQSLNSKFIAKAAAFYKLNLENYPESSSAYVAYGDFLVLREDTTNAIAYYQKAYAINKSDETLQKLNSLQGNAVFKLSADQLQKYAGVYVFESLSITSAVVLKDGALWIAVTGQPAYELVPLSPDTFSIKNISGFKLHFEMDGDKPSTLVSTQPNGTFVGNLKR